jgi:hypothetical protein
VQPNVYPAAVRSIVWLFKGPPVLVFLIFQIQGSSGSGSLKEIKIKEPLVSVLSKVP